MEITVFAMQPNGNFKESRELLAREDQIFGSIGEQFSFLEENDAINFGNNFRDVMSDEKDAESGASELAHDQAKLELTGNVEGVARLVEEQGVRIVNQGASDERALGFSGGHFEDRAFGKVSDAHAGQGGVSVGVMFGMRPMIGENAGAAEEAGEHHVETGGVGSASGEEIRGDDAEGGAKFKDIPE